MVDPEARAEIAAAPSTSETRTLLVEFDTVNPVSPGGGSRRDRLDALRQRRDSVRSVWLQEFERRGARVEVLSAAPSLIVSAPIVRWQEWTGPGGWLTPDNGLHVRPTGRFEALDHG